MIKNTPPMGWNTWNTFGENINEELVKKTADILCETGLKDKGYEYVILDDCWSLRERDSNGRMVADPVKFPSGMKALGDYLHSKGLKFGIYSCIGTFTCQKYPGSFDYEFIDAQTFAEWGVDYLKYDHCYRPESLKSETLYRRMSIALANCGRDILFNTCSWGEQETAKWINSIDAHAWRSTGDIFDKWESIKGLFEQQFSVLGLGGKNCFNDMDMLVVGMKGKGNVGLGGCSVAEYSAHFDIWAFMCSGLIIGCDIREMDKDTLDILSNEEVIAINQDEECCAPYRERQSRYAQMIKDKFTVAKQLSGNRIAFGFFNFADSKVIQTSYMTDFGIPAYANKSLLFRNIQTCEKFIVKDAHSVELEPHSCAVYIAEFVD